MAWYTTHRLRYRGRLLRVGSRYGSYNGAVVLKGKPLDLTDGSVDDCRIAKLFGRNEGIRRDIMEFVKAMNEECR